MNVSDRLWAVVKVNLVDPGRDAEEFDRWYNELHVPEFVEQDGFHRGWRLQTQGHTSTLGDRGQQYAAVYEIDAIPAFKAALDASPSAGHSWGEWDGRVTDWTRIFYDVVASVEQDAKPGHFWAIIRTHFSGDAGKETEFNEWYSTRHMPEVCSNPGFHRAWRLRAHPDSNQLGEPKYRYWAVYEIDRPADFVKARAGKQPWGGIWQDLVIGWSRSYHRLTFVYEKETGEKRVLDDELT